jgi:hypothetical protein
MIAASTLRLAIEVEPGSTPLTGTLVGPGETVLEFCGWTSLASAIETAMAEPTNETAGRRALRDD